MKNNLAEHLSALAVSLAGVRAAATSRQFAQPAHGIFHLVANAFSLMCAIFCYV